MKMDNFTLISEVAKRETLWNTSMKMCVRKDINVVLWKEVSEIMNLEVNVCKKRFKSLRDCYRSEIRKIQQKRIEMTHWPYFRALEFMRPIFDPYNEVPFSPLAHEVQSNESEKLDDFLVDVDSDDSIAFDVMDDIFKQDSPQQQTPTADMSQIKERLELSLLSSNKPMTQEPELELSTRQTSPPATRTQAPKRRRRKTSSSEEHVRHSTGKKAALAAEAAEHKDDADYNFLVSLLPHMKSLTNMCNLKFRMEISRILVELKREDMQSEPLAREPENPTASAMPKLIPAPTSFSCVSETTKYAVSTNLNGGYYLDSPPITVECDVKIENEPLYKD